jgi:hypothetical protein
LKRSTADRLLYGKNIEKGFGRTSVDDLKRIEIGLVMSALVEDGITQSRTST